MVTTCLPKARDGPYMSAQALGLMGLGQDLATRLWFGPNLRPILDKKDAILGKKGVILSKKCAKMGIGPSEGGR